MARRARSFNDPRPAFPWRAASGFTLAAVVALGALALGRNGSLSGPRNVADSALAPVGTVLSVPVRAASGGANFVSDYLFAARQNAELKRRLAVARQWRDQLVAERLENARLRALLGVRTDPPLPMVFAHTLLDARGPFNRTRLCDAGSNLGVTEGNPAIAARGLVGRVSGVGPGACRILLLSDVESRVPVMLPRTNGRAILMGDGGPNPALGYLRTHDAVKEGDRVLTSGDGGVIPRGLPVGSVVRGLDGSWRVALDADDTGLDDVRILLFHDFSQVAAQADLAPKTLPSLATEPPPPQVAPQEQAPVKGGAPAKGAAAGKPKP